MNIAEVISQLEGLGTEQNRKVFRRHGVLGPQYGVSFANLDKLAKQLKKQKEPDGHSLAFELWATGNHDARLLAAKIANPAMLDEPTIDAWVHDLDNYVITDAFSGLVAHTPFARQKVAQWITLDEEWPAAAGWNILSDLALHDKELSDDFFDPYLEEIQTTIHNRKNRVRYSMNNAMIAIGVRNHDLESQSLVTAAQVGLVEVDHGETNCKTPDAATYIRQTWEYRQKKAEKK